MPAARVGQHRPWAANFAALGLLLGRDVPGSEREAGEVLAFYRRHGPLARDAFEAACRRSGASLGNGRALTTYLADLERQISADDGGQTKPQPEEQP